MRIIVWSLYGAFPSTTYRMCLRKKRSVTPLSLFLSLLWSSRNSIPILQYLVGTHNLACMDYTKPHAMLDGIAGLLLYNWPIGRAECVVLRLSAHSTESWKWVWSPTIAASIATSSQSLSKTAATQVLLDLLNEGTAKTSHQWSHNMTSDIVLFLYLVCPGNFVVVVGWVVGMGDHTSHVVLKQPNSALSFLETVSRVELPSIASHWWLEVFVVYVVQNRIRYLHVEFEYAVESKFIRAS